MLSVAEHQGLHSWRLTGVIYQRPNISDNPSEAISGFEVIKAPGADSILPNAGLDTQLWHSITFSSARQIERYADHLAKKARGAK